MFKRSLLKPKSHHLKKLETSQLFSTLEIIAKLNENTNNKSDSKKIFVATIEEILTRNIKHLGYKPFLLFFKATQSINPRTDIFKLALVKLKEFQIDRFYMHLTDVTHFFKYINDTPGIVFDRDIFMSILQHHMKS
jgi:hypothetical protein